MEDFEQINMEDFKKIIRNDRYAVHSGIELTEVRPGYAKAEMKIKDYHLNAGNVVQGGAIFTLADFAFAAAANAYGNLTLSIQTSIYFHKGVGCGTLYAVAQAVKIGQNIGNFEVRVSHDSGALIATFTAVAYRKDIPFLHIPSPVH
jgi:acyl-CoA thioesterase